MAKISKAHCLINSWYKKARWLYLLWPVSLVYRAVTHVRRSGYQRGFLSSWQAPVPVIVVGNITVGGTGKTPLVLSLVSALQNAGLHPAIVSRGYTSKAPSYPYLVTPQSNPVQAGDEPLLLAIRSKVPVMIGANRIESIKTLLKNHPCNVIVCDDGLQHYALKRDIEMLVIDGERMFGNQHCLPVGPLREPLPRLERCDYIISNGIISGELQTQVPTFEMKLEALGFAKLASSNETIIALSAWHGSKEVHAVAGIGNPDRFFNDLRAMGFSVTEHIFDDHHAYTSNDLRFADTRPIIMTEKDAVKVRSLAPADYLDRCWYVPVNAVTDNTVFAQITARVKHLLSN